MRHVILTCKHHPELRWSCKDTAWNGGETGGYNGSRGIFFYGTPSGKGMFRDRSGLDCTRIHPRTGEIVMECSCSARDLVLAPEDGCVYRTPGAAREG